MKYIMPFGMTTKLASELVKKEFKRRYGMSYGEWHSKHKDNAILAANLTDSDICLTVCGVLPPEIRKTTMSVKQFKQAVDNGNYGAALDDLKESLCFWQKGGY